MSQFLQRPFADASLAEHLEYGRLQREMRSTSALRSLEFLRAERGVVSQSLRFPYFELPNLDRAVSACYRDWQCVEELCAGSSWLKLPRYERFEIRPGKRRSLLSEGGRLLRSPDDRRRVYYVGYDHTNEHGWITLFAPTEERAALFAELRTIQRASRRRHYLRGQVVRGDGTLLRRHHVDWSQVALDRKTRDTLWNNSIDLLDRRAEYARHGVPLQRGILLHGPPGTGKTMIGRALAAESRASFVWVTSGDFQEHDITVRSVFKLARKLRPAMILFEDLDLYASQRQGYTDRNALGELLTQLDGFERNDGLIVIGTTNDLDAIEPAIKDRPSRFDIVLEIGLPQIDARRQILERRWSRVHVTPELLDAAAQATHGLSGAQVQEVAVRSVQLALSHGTCNEDGQAAPTVEQVAAAANALLGRSPRKIGFAATDDGSN